MGLFKGKKEAKADFSNVRSGSSSMPDASAQREGAPSKYTVRKGDTLSAIAKREYGKESEWRRIFEANRDQIDNPDLIRPGQELTIPRESGGAS
jgi:nucleoid-associated protein YgaU